MVLNPVCGTMTLQMRMGRIRTFAFNVRMQLSIEKRFLELEKIPIYFQYAYACLNFAYVASQRMLP